MIAPAEHRGKHKSVESAVAVLNQKYEGAKADYQATKKGRFNRRRQNLPSYGGSADYHIRSDWEYYNLIEDCYDLERNDAVVGQLLDRRSCNVIQGGFRLEPHTGDKGLDVALKERWNDWAEDPDQCDVSGESCFHDFEFASDWTMVLAGDCGISLTESGQLQFFEPYLIRDENIGSQDGIFLGVEQTEERYRLAYWIAEDSIDPYDQSFLTQSSPIDVRAPNGMRQFFHVYDRKRMTLTRGVTAFAPIFELTGMLEDVNFAKLVQQQIVSCIAYLIESSVEGEKLPSVQGENNFGHERELYLQNQTGPKTYDKVEPGMEVDPGPGKKVTGFSPQVPNPEYFDQYRLILQLICGALDMPISVGMMDASKDTWHGFIGAGNEAKKLWKKSQHRMIKRLHKPCTIGKFYHFAQEDRLFRNARKRLGRDYYKHTWHPPVWQSVKPLDDTNDRLARLRNALISPSKMQAELNVDFESHVAETVSDNSLIIRTAKAEAVKINAEFDDGQPVHWTQLYPMPTAEGMQTTKTLAPEEETTEGDVLEETITETERLAHV